MRRNLETVQIPSAAEIKRFSVQINKSETSGELADQFQSGAEPTAFLGLSPTSASSNRCRLRAILEYLLPLVESVTIVDGSWFHRWDLVVFDRLSLDDATERALTAMKRLHRRIRELVVDLGATQKVKIVSWPETHDLLEMNAIRADLWQGMERSSKLAAALQGTVTDYLREHRKDGVWERGEDDLALLLNYVVEEVSTATYLSLRVSPLEVYPGPDIALMRRIATGEFVAVFPYDLSRRSHISLELIEIAVGNLRQGRASDWPEIECLLRAWPTHFVEKAISCARNDFLNYRTTLCDDGFGRVIGFLIWRTDGREIEMLWMAVDPLQVRRGIGRSIVCAMLCERSGEHRVFGRTATTDSRISHSTFSGPAFGATHSFFQRLGFTLGTRHERYWGPENHMVEIEKVYDHG